MAEAIVPTGAPMPVMDVVAPPAEQPEKSDASPTGEADPVDALAAADKQTQQAATDNKPQEKVDKHVKAEHTPAKPKELSGNGVGMAIAATVIIVFGLAILAVYAYMQTNK